MKKLTVRGTFTRPKNNLYNIVRVEKGEDIFFKNTGNENIELKNNFAGSNLLKPSEELTLYDLPEEIIFFVDKDVKINTSKILTPILIGLVLVFLSGGILQ